MKHLKNVNLRLPFGGELIAMTLHHQFLHKPNLLFPVPCHFEDENEHKLELKLHLTKKPFLDKTMLKKSTRTVRWTFTDLRPINYDCQPELNIPTR